MNKYFKNPYGGVKIADFSTPDLSKYRFISTTAQGNRTYRRETPKPPTKDQKASILHKHYRSVHISISNPQKPNILNKYERRRYMRLKAWIDRHYPF